MSSSALDIQVDEEGFLVDGEPWAPVILEGALEDPVDPAYNTALVRLEAGVCSDLNWKSAIERASHVRQAGLRIFWELDLHLFDGLKEPLSDQAQFQALALAIEHFGKEIWPQFADASIGACIYRGTGDFSKGFRWSADQEENYKSWSEDLGVEGWERLYCRDASVSFLELLAARLPDDCQAFVCLDLSGVPCPWERLLIQSRDQYPYLHRILYPSARGEVALSWREGNSRWGALGHPSECSEPEARIGLCLPDLKDALKLPEEVWGPVLKELESKGYRAIPEADIVTSWHGLDVLWVFSDTVGSQCRRMLQGFEAAGGEVRYL